MTLSDNSSPANPALAASLDNRILESLLDVVGDLVHMREKIQGLMDANTNTASLHRAELNLLASRSFSFIRHAAVYNELMLLKEGKSDG